MINFIYGDEFIKEFQKLRKAYPSLGEYNDGGEGDFTDFKKALQQSPISLGGVERIDQLGKEVLLPVFKVTKFACKSLRDTKKLRIVYVYDKQSESLQFIEFIEFYAKADKENEDRERIKKLLAGKTELNL